MPTTYYSPIECPGGFTPFTDPTAIGTRVIPAALWWDGLTKQWQLDGDQWASVHPVDQGMMIGCCFRRGSVPSAPDVGHTVFEIGNLGAANLKDDVDSRMRSANPVARLIAAGQAEIDRVDVAVEPHGRLLVQVAYFNLVTDPGRKQPRNLKVP